MDIINPDENSFSILSRMSTPHSSPVFFSNYVFCKIVCLSSSNISKKIMDGF